MTNPALLARLTAAFLASSAPLQLLGWLLFSAHLVATVFAFFASHWGLVVIGVLAVLLALPLAYFSLRIKFDEQAFKLIGKHPHAQNALQEFDAALIQLQLRKTIDARGLAERALGAKHLVVRLSLVVALQLLITLVGIGLDYVV